MQTERFTYFHLVCHFYAQAELAEAGFKEKLLNLNLSERIKQIIEGRK